MACILAPLNGSLVGLAEGRTTQHEQNAPHMEPNPLRPLPPGNRKPSGWSTKLLCNAALLLTVGFASHFLRP